MTVAPSGLSQALNGQIAERALNYATPATIPYVQRSALLADALQSMRQHGGENLRTPTALWSNLAAEALLKLGSGQASQQLQQQSSQLGQKLPWFAALDDPRQDVLANMAYNMGVAGLLQFKNTLGAVQAGDYARAATGMLASQWACQVKGRADRLAEQMRTGVHA